MPLLIIFSLSYLLNYLTCSPNLQLVMRDAQHLHTMISSTSDLAEKVSSKVRLLDLVKVCEEQPKFVLLLDINWTGQVLICYLTL